MARFSLVLLLLLFVIPTVGVAASRVWPTGYWSPLLSCVGSASSVASGPPNPPKVCTSLCDTLATAQNIVDFGMSLVVFVLTPLLVLWGGIVVITAGSSPGRLTYGRGVLTKTALGLLVVLGAYVIVSTFLWVVGARTSGSEEGGPVGWPNIECKL